MRQAFLAYFVCRTVPLQCWSVGDRFTISKYKVATTFRRIRASAIWSKGFASLSLSMKNVATGSPPRTDFWSDKRFVDLSDSGKICRYSVACMFAHDLASSSRQCFDGPHRPLQGRNWGSWPAAVLLRQA